MISTTIVPFSETASFLIFLLLIISAAVDIGSLELIVINGEDIIFSTGVSNGRLFAAIFVAKSLSVIMPVGFPFSLTSIAPIPPCSIIFAICKAVVVRFTEIKAFAIISLTRIEELESSRLNNVSNHYNI